MTLFDDVLIEYKGTKKAPMYFNDSGDKYVFQPNDEFGGKKICKVPGDLAAVLLKYPRLYARYEDDQKNTTKDTKSTNHVQQKKNTKKTRVRSKRR